MIPNSTKYRDNDESDGELNSDNEIKPIILRNYYENSKNDAIPIESSSSDSELEMMDVKMPEKKVNDVWRNIIECDLLQQQINNIAYEQRKVQRDVESYELPPNRKRKCSRFHRRNGKRNRYRRKNYVKIENNHEVLVLEDDDDEVDSGRKQARMNCDDGGEVIDIVSDEGDAWDSVDARDVASSNMNSLESNCLSEASSESSSSSSGSDSSDSEGGSGKRRKLKMRGRKMRARKADGAWNRLAKRMQNDEMLMEFENGRKQLAQNISKKLDEPKVDLIDRCLYYLGLEKCKVFLEAVKEIEECGGMPTKDGSRRRTAGGVFFTLIRADRSMDKSLKQQIFNETEDSMSQEDGASLWWKSLEILQYRFNCNVPNYSKQNNNSNSGTATKHSYNNTNNRANGNARNCTSNFARRKEFKSYTLIDIDFFEAIPGFQYRYIPMMANFPIQKSDTGSPSRNGSYGNSSPVITQHRQGTPTRGNAGVADTLIVLDDDEDEDEDQDDYFMRLPEHLDPFNPLDL